MALKASKEASKTVRNAKVPNKRERAAAQFGQIDDQLLANWSDAAAVPATIKEALNRLAARVQALEDAP